MSGSSTTVATPLLLTEVVNRASGLLGSYAQCVAGKTQDSRFLDVNVSWV